MDTYRELRDIINEINPYQLQCYADCSECRNLVMIELGLSMLLKDILKTTKEQKTVDLIVDHFIGLRSKKNLIKSNYPSEN